MPGVIDRDPRGSTATPTPSQTARSRLTTNPYVGIVGVFLGAGIATLNSRLISVGLPDLRGALGLSFDEASWIPTALNMAMMFSGVFLVFLNTLYGPRRILLPCAAIFTGRRCTIFVKLPVALSGGNKANCEPLAGAT